jgi:hypothetical protein
MSRRGLSAVGLCTLLAACSTSSPRAVAPPTPSPSAVAASPTPAPRTALELAQLGDHARHIWALGDVASGQPATVDLVPALFGTRLIGKAPDSTPGPAGGTSAGRFLGKGRYITPVRASEIGSDRAFTIEFAFRSDTCTRHWTQVMGTGAFTKAGRQGLNVLHYPADFKTPCRMAFEFWKDNAYTGGCSTANVVTHGRWELFALTYDKTTATCWNDGKKIAAGRPGPWTSAPGTNVGIGGSASGWGGLLDSGSLADVALYPGALTAAQLARHAAALHAG